MKLDRSQWEKIHNRMDTLYVEVAHLMADEHTEKEYKDKWFELLEKHCEVPNAAS